MNIELVGGHVHFNPGLAQSHLVTSGVDFSASTGEAVDTLAIVLSAGGLQLCFCKAVDLLVQKGRGGTTLRHSEAPPPWTNHTHKNDVLFPSVVWPCYYQ